MSLIKSLISKEKYSTKCPYLMSRKGICIHNTANDASARNEINYMKSNSNEVSFHIAIDDKEAILGIPLNRNTWHAGDGEFGEGNRNYISIEICYSKSGGERFELAEKRAAKEIALLLKEYNLKLENIKSHKYFSGKYCPHRTLDLGWNRFLNMVKKEINNNEIKVQNINGELYRVRKDYKNIKSQIGAFRNIQNAKKLVDENPGYKVYNEKGVKIYPN